MQVYKIIYYTEDEKTNEWTYYTTNEDFDHSWLCEIDQKDLVKCDEHGKNYDQN
jgi:hypothetical protein